MIGTLPSLFMIFPAILRQISSTFYSWNWNTEWLSNLCRLPQPVNKIQDYNPDNLTVEPVPLIAVLYHYHHYHHLYHQLSDWFSEYWLGKTWHVGYIAKAVFSESWALTASGVFSHLELISRDIICSFTFQGVKDCDKIA